MSQTLKYGTRYHIRSLYSDSEYLDANGLARGCKDSNLYDVCTSPYKDRVGAGTGVWRMLPIEGGARKDGDEVLLEDSFYLENVYAALSYLDACGASCGCKENKLDVSTSRVRDRTRGEKTSIWKLQRPANNGDKGPICEDEQVHIVNQWIPSTTFLDVCGASPDVGAIRDVSASATPTRSGLSGTWSFVAFDDSGKKANEGLVGQIANVLRTNPGYEGVTYQISWDNTLTLLDTPRLWDQSPVAPSPYSGACEDLLKEIESTIGNAKGSVDIAFMAQMHPHAGMGPPLPGGAFQEALSKGFWWLSTNRSKAVVRIIIGIPVPQSLKDSNVQSWFQDTIELHQKLSDVHYPIRVACCRQSANSWNHSKIVAADGVRTVVGGHNLWADDYLGSRPVHDVSLVVQGSAVSCAHRFCDTLWKRTSVSPYAFQLKNGEIKQLEDRDKVPWEAGEPQVQVQKGTTRILSLGRLGEGLANNLTISSNASVSARLMALCNAQKNIYISQQSLFFTVASFGGFDFYTLWALVKAIESGVKVDIVISNDTSASDGGYAGDIKTVLDSMATLYVAHRLGLYRPNPDPARTDLKAWAEASLKSAMNNRPSLWVDKLPSPAQCAPYLKELNEHLKIAQLYYAKNTNYWEVENKRKPAANHAKVYIIDDTHFYVGSDNMYLSVTVHGLQEFGHMIEGQPETRNFIANYWDKLWKNSAEHAVQAQFSNLQLRLRDPDE